ncbi:hypothetical protein ACOMHN_039000 [Nucella lapillus]
MGRRSGRSRTAGRRGGSGTSGRNHKTNGKKGILKESESPADFHTTTEPEVGAEAPGSPAGGAADAQEVMDDVEFPEAVVLVGKTHWRCVTCMILQPRALSIDDHLNTHHRRPDSSPAPPVSLSPGRGEGEGRGVNRNSVINHIPTASEPETAEVLRLSALPVEDGDSQNISNKKDTVPSSSEPLQGRRKNGRGGSRKKRVGSGRGRGRVLTKPLTSEDSDNEMETAALSSPVKALPAKRKLVTAVPPANELPEAVLQTDGTSTEEVRCPPSKKARSEENRIGCVTAVSYEPSVEPMGSKEFAPRDTWKDVMKEKYVVFVSKGGTLDYLVDSESHFDNDPPLPIETPSLQADAFLPPATPLLPDIHGAPETPVPPETPHPPEVPHHPDHFHPSEVCGINCQQSSQSHLLLLVTPGTDTVPPSSQHLAMTEEGVHMYSDQSMVRSHHFSSDGLLTNKSSDRDLPSVCVTCGAPFESPEELRLHRGEMVKFDVVSCNSCGEKFHGLHQLNIHIFTTHEKFAKKFCFLCDVDCLDGFELEEHLLEHTWSETDEEDADDPESVQHTCKTCGLEMEGNLSDLMNHYHTTHDQFVCPKCYALFTYLTEYEDHKMLHCPHADSAAVVYSCPVSDCFQLCESKEGLMDHISWHEDRDIHEELQSVLQCHYCSADFRNLTALQRHLADTHSEPDLRPFVCELCRADFSHSLELHQHNAKCHAGIKRYGCAYCDQRFAFRSAHRRHVASEHDVPATVLRM